MAVPSTMVLLRTPSSSVGALSIRSRRNSIRLLLASRALVGAGSYVSFNTHVSRQSVGFDADQIDFFLLVSLGR